MKISRIYEAVKKNLRVDVAKCKETSKLNTEYLFLLKEDVHRVAKHSENMGMVEI